MSLRSKCCYAACCCCFQRTFLDAMKRYFWFRSFEDSTTLSSPQENGLTWKSLLSSTRVYRQSKIPATESSRVRWREGLTNTLRLLATSLWRVCLLRSRLEHKIHVSLVILMSCMTVHVCFCRIAPWDCQEDAVTHDLAWLKRTLSRKTGSVFSRNTSWDC